MAPLKELHSRLVEDTIFGYINIKWYPFNNNFLLNQKMRNLALFCHWRFFMRQSAIPMSTLADMNFHVHTCADMKVCPYGL